ncbi:hypothetical protein [Rubritalea tangerina]|uniref:Uncharacterized protein n=1 Tax=Rubritalea tangerina TaxID=430798 RepID=A0ABW4Z8B9_9BACT
MSEASVIVCKPTQWIKIRALLIILMFGVFAYLFYQDGTTGYRKKNAHYIYHQLLNDEAPKEVDKYDTKEAWAAFVRQKQIELPGEEDCPLPADFDRDQKWPEELVEAYDELKGSSKAKTDVWIAYSGARGWDSEPAEHLFDQSDLNTQFYMFYGCVVIVVVVTALFLRTLTRTMEVTGEAYLAPGGKKVPFSAMRRIDARKWDTKGMAVIEFDEGGVTKKAKVDGMIYGQFKKEDGEPAEKLYQYILERFEGELIEFEQDSEDDETDGESEAAEDNKNSGGDTNS